MHWAVVVAGMLLLLSTMWQPSEALCSPTIFYRDCWIRRFPGLLLDLEESQKQGAQLLKYYTENTGQNCGQSCCLHKDVSCNLAVFYHDPMHDSANCLHAYCPTLESCILAPGLGAVLYNITEGVDPDLLVFQRAPASHLNTRRLWVLQASSAELGPSTEPHPQWPSVGGTPPASQGWDMNNGPRLPQDSSTDSWTELTSQGGSVSTEGRRVSPQISSTFGPDNRTLGPSFLPTDFGASRALPPSRLNDSKQFSNKTKGSPGSSQQAEEGDAAPAEAPGSGKSWLVPLALCASAVSLCWIIMVTTPRCWREQQGWYSPGQRKLQGAAS